MYSLIKRKWNLCQLLLPITSLINEIKETLIESKAIIGQIVPFHIAENLSWQPPSSLLVCVEYVDFFSLPHFRLLFLLLLLLRHFQRRYTEKKYGTGENKVKLV